MSNNQVSATIPGLTASRNWKRIAKEIAASGDSFYESRCRLNLLDAAYSPYNYESSSTGMFKYVSDMLLEEQYMLALFLAEFVLTDGVME